MIAIMLGALQKIFLSDDGVRHAAPGGTAVFHRGDPVDRVFWVESGLVELVRFQENGDPLILQSAGDGSLLAEASLYSDVYHCDAIVRQSAAVLSVSKITLRHRLEVDRTLAASWCAYLAKEVQHGRSRAEILSRKTVSKRLDGWLTLTGRSLPPKGEWRSVADQIAVSPEALYRELAKRRAAYDQN
ncbi:Crp/Fnr family transcriptional regulator [Pacificispira sp.]|uniref:Crp/Fnr family transcriptional regulator n=1 Tax=Pacificispira sp. TaxID=2888761 RepID=UPI003BACDC75